MAYIYKAKVKRDGFPLSLHLGQGHKASWKQWCCQGQVQVQLASKVNGMSCESFHVSQQHLRYSFHHYFPLGMCQA
ncbi:hypothetical protein OIU76_012312 [Salix suchowensis]|nr:hypothetical protein OIU76_012312 [Salix suchowensis]